MFRSCSSNSDDYSPQTIEKLASRSHLARHARPNPTGSQQAVDKVSGECGARQKSARKRSVHTGHEHFEPVFNAGSCPMRVFQQPAGEPTTDNPQSRGTQPGQREISWAWRARGRCADCKRRICQWIERSCRRSRPDSTRPDDKESRACQRRDLPANRTGC